MPPKKKEQTFDLASFAAPSEGATWAEQEEATFSVSDKPAFIIGGGSGGGWSSHGEAPVPDYPPFTARVGNVSYNVTEHNIEEFFASHNLKTQSVRLPRNAEGQIRGNAYVDFPDKQSLVQALALAGSEILERRVSIQVAEQQRGGGGGGGDFDWSRRQTPARSVDPSVDERFSRFRAQQPQLDWSKHVTPPAAAGGPPGLGGFRREPREPREPRDGPSFDWSARRAPPVVPPAELRRNRPRPPRQQEEEFDWSKHVTPPAARRQAPAPTWGPPSGDRKPLWGPKRTEERTQSAPAPAQKDDRKRQQEKLGSMANSFSVLQEDEA